MEPTLPMPQSPERSSAPAPVPGETAVGGLESGPAATPERTGELHPTMAPAPAPIAPPAQSPQMAAPVAQPTAQAIPQDSPMIADDVDVLEKEWVDKAKRIVNATRDDPHQQEKEVSKLQADYLMKRYNKKIKLAE